MTASVQSWLFHLHGPVVYIAIGALVGLESAILIGFFVPGELAAVIGGVIASQRHANVVVMIVVVAATASIGNVIGFELGRIVGPWLMRHRPLRDNAGVARTEKLITDHGAPAVFIGRWIAIVRAFVPAVAGLLGMGRRSFVLFATAAAVLWGIAWVLVGYVAGSSYTTLVHAVGRWSLVVVAVVVIAVAVALVTRKVRQRRHIA